MIIDTSHKDMANALRFLAIDAVEKAGCGHPGMPMGMADVATVLFSKFLKFDPRHPTWPNRDRFVLSAGHGSMLLYALLHLTGYTEMTLEEIKHFRQLHSLTPGHPEVAQEVGIEMTTGPLGQGLATAVGMALAERVLNARFGADQIDHHTYVIASDGDLMEGLSHEACSLAGHLNLNRLIVLYDDNEISIDGAMSLSCSDDALKRFESYGWQVNAIDGHDPAQIEQALTQAQTANAPTLIACKTKIGFGSPNKEGTSAAHGAALGSDEVAAVRQKLNWPHAPFELPESIVSAWRTVASRHHQTFESWHATPELDTFLSAKIPDDLLQSYTQKMIEDSPTIATRSASGDILELLCEHLPNLIGGSGDLTPSNNTKTKTSKVITKESFDGNYLHYGIREHAMAAAMNGMALYGGIIPYGGTFMSFTDYCRPAIRLSALMQQRVIYVMTHDSIGLGEDGPTHQPVEHLSALRAIPNLHVLRPADPVETAECWQIALESLQTPSVLSLTRQSVPTVRHTHGKENRSKKGAYILSDSKGDTQVTLIATGSEVHIALDVQERLHQDNIGARVVSMPCTELFDEQTEDYKNDTLGTGTLRVGIEAAASWGWERYLGTDGLFIGMNGFGESAPAPNLYEYFEITAAAALFKIKQRL